MQSLGYQVIEQPFRFLPGALNAFPLLGAGLVWLALLLLPLLHFPGVPGFGAPLMWAIGVAAVALLAWRMGSGIPIPGAEEREDANLIALRPDATVRRWIVAHLDTKAQGHSMAGRLVAAWLMVTAFGAMTTLALLRWLADVPPPNGWVILGAMLSVAAGALAGRGKLRGRSPGARDNGSGLLTAFVAAEIVKDPATGFLFTSAEEFGLVGARVFVRSPRWTPGAEVLNVDTIDQSGELYLVSHNREGRRLAGRVKPALAALDLPVTVRNLPLGILTDSLPFARRGAAAITIARLDWGTLGLIHTPRDTPEGLLTATATRLGGLLAQLPPPAKG